MAYYRTIPKKSKVPRYEYHKENLHFPKVDDYYLIDYLDLLGYHSKSYSIDFSEIQSFAQMMELDLSIYEVTSLKKMSEAYIVECSKTDENTPMPFINGERKKIPLSVLKAKFGIK